MSEHQLYSEREVSTDFLSISCLLTLLLAIQVKFYESNGFHVQGSRDIVGPKEFGEERSTLFSCHRTLYRPYTDLERFTGNSIVVE